MKNYVFNPKYCSGCGACVAACLDQNDIDLAGGEAAYCWIKETELSEGHYKMERLSCMHCEEPACAPACPLELIYKEEKTGFVLYDNKSCLGCGSCKDACEHGAIHFNKNHKMVKCDGCYSRVMKGLDQACRRTCPLSVF